MADSCAASVSTYCIATLPGCIPHIARKDASSGACRSGRSSRQPGVTLSAVVFCMRMQRAPGHVLFQNKNGGTGNLGKSCTLSFKHLLLHSFLVCNVLCYFVSFDRRSLNSTFFANSCTKQLTQLREMRRKERSPPLLTPQTV